MPTGGYCLNLTGFRFFVRRLMEGLSQLNLPEFHYFEVLPLEADSNFESWLENSLMRCLLWRKEGFRRHDVVLRGNPGGSEPSPKGVVAKSALSRLDTPLICLFFDLFCQLEQVILMVWISLLSENTDPGYKCGYTCPRKGKSSKDSVLILKPSFIHISYLYTGEL